MRFLAFLGVFAALFSFTAQAHTVPAQAPKVKIPDSERFYLENGKDMNHSQWGHDGWRPEDWLESRGSAERVLNDFRTAGIITDQYDDGGTPVLEVGEGFMNLSSIDKRRVAAFVDHVYGITNGHGGVFFIYHQRTDKPIGMYTKYGLQIQ